MATSFISLLASGFPTYASFQPESVFWPRGSAESNSPKLEEAFVLWRPKEWVGSPAKPGKGLQGLRMLPKFDLEPPRCQGGSEGPVKSHLNGVVTHTLGNLSKLKKKKTATFILYSTKHPTRRESQIYFLKN